MAEEKLKFCVDCKHFLSYCGGVYECFVNSQPNLVTGRLVGKEPNWERSPRGECGPEGIFWVAKEKTDVK